MKSYFSKKHDKPGVNNAISRRQAGASLTEYLLYAALAGVVIVGATKLFGGGQSSTDVNSLISDMTSIRSNTRQAVGNTGNYGTANADLTASLITTKAFPSTMGGTGTTRSNSWNGAVTVKVGTVSSNFVITTTNVPQDVCVKYLASLDSTWQSVAVNGATAITSFPISMTTATGATGCSNATNTIALTST